MFGTNIDKIEYVEFEGDFFDRDHIGDFSPNSVIGDCDSCGGTSALMECDCCHFYHSQTFGSCNKEGTF